MIVLDEAHLYRGAAGAEVGLLLRRLRDRLNIPPERFQVICATASFEDHHMLPQFGAQLSGKNASDFVPIPGDLLLREPSSTADSKSAGALAQFDLVRFYSEDDNERIDEVKKLVHALGGDLDASQWQASLYDVLRDFAPLNLLVNKTMKQAIPLLKLRDQIFEQKVIDPEQGIQALTTLLALGSTAKPAPTEASLLPCRVHAFFRGLPGLWVCMDLTATADLVEVRSERCMRNRWTNASVVPASSNCSLAEIAAARHMHEHTPTTLRTQRFSGRILATPFDL